MNVAAAGAGERRMDGSEEGGGGGGGETLLVTGAGVHTSLWWFVGVGNACLFTRGSPVEKATAILCQARQTLQMKRDLNRSCLTGPS